jgi:hypothetical protein
MDETFASISLLELNRRNTFAKAKDHDNRIHESRIEGRSTFMDALRGVLQRLPEKPAERMDWRRTHMRTQNTKNE